MKFVFTRTPLKDVPLASVVDGYCITSRSHTGNNAVGYQCTKHVQDNGYMRPAEPFRQALLIYTESEFIKEMTIPQ